MKLKFTLFPAACIFLTLLALQPFSSMASPNENGEGDESAAKKSARTKSSNNNNSVKIYPDALKRVMHVVAKGTEGTQMDFFVFDLEGTLIKHYKMEAGEHQKLTGLNRGKYVYRVFTGDEETAAGNLEIR
jgi:hypothetical protein